MGTGPLASIVATPLVEVSLAVITDEVIVDPYRIANLHQLFATDFPGAERLSPIVNVENASMLGIPDVVRESDVSPSNRWMFTSSDNANVVQLQERFITRNWRRTKGMDAAVEYPGYDCLSNDFRKTCEVVRKASPDQSVCPVGCQLIYDNMVMLQGPGGTRTSLQDVLRNWNSVDPNQPIMGWQLQWSEPVVADNQTVPEGGPVDLDMPILFVQVALGTLLKESGELAPVLRLSLNVTARANTWDEVFDVFEAGHRKIEQVFVRTTTDTIRERWSRT